MLVAFESNGKALKSRGLGGEVWEIKKCTANWLRRNRDTQLQFASLAFSSILEPMDIVSPAVRSRMMAAVKSKNGSLEKMVFLALRRRGVRFARHYKQLPGTPDVAFPRAKKAIFIDGDFWHGYRYPSWKRKIRSKFWREKIEANRLRDRKNFRKLRRLGWRVMRVWEHDVRKRPVETFQKIYRFILS
jgi:DNA mismatch endonuclease (patch repair protein)